MMKTPHRKGVSKGIDWRLTRFLLSHLALGAVSGWIFVGALFYFNVGGLGDLIADPVSGPLAAVMLLIVVTITWGSAAMGTAVFLLPRDEEDEDKGGGRRAGHSLLAPALQPAPVSVKTRRR
ncbi:hypothetical protein [Hyphococcus sp.]|uniref:hypothetical protein n=1 Tax=Hyphococcus sp. TaxID=2038636 RepID=UPI0035C75068